MNESLYCRDTTLIEVFKTWQATFEACRRAGIVGVSARQLKPIKKLKLKLTTKS